MSTENYNFPTFATKSYRVAPRLLGRADAAHYLGIGPTLFDGLVCQGLMPRPKQIGKRRLWDIRELDEAIDELPQADRSDQIGKARDPFDDVHA